MTSRHATPEEWPTLLRDGDLVVVAGGAGEPTSLLEALAKAPAEELPAAELFVGLSHSGVLDDPPAVGLASFGAMGPLARHAARGDLAIVPCAFVDLPRVLPLRARGRVVVLLSVAPLGADGRHSLGVAVDHAYELAARGGTVVIAEINDRMPHTDGPSLAPHALDAAIEVSHPLPAPVARTERQRHRAIARHVAGLVPDGATLQLGVGALPAVVAEALADHRDLRVRSTLVGDWLLVLARAGALSSADEVVLSEAAGCRALHDHVASGGAHVRTVAEVVDPGVLAGLDCLVALNSALEVDLSGQVNAEETASGYVGGVAGQPDFMRAAQRTLHGRSVVMLPATGSGISRIVPRLHRGTVTTGRASVDFVVTEYGVADLRGSDLTMRARALIEVAAPDHRASLRQAHEEGQ